MITSFPLNASHLDYFSAAARRENLLQRTCLALSVTGLELAFAALAWRTMRGTGGLPVLVLILGLAIASAAAGSILRKRYGILASPAVQQMTDLVRFFACAMLAVLAFTGLDRLWILYEAGVLLGFMTGLSGLFDTINTANTAPQDQDKVRIGCLVGLLLAAMLLLVYTHLPVPNWLIFAPGQLASAAGFVLAGLIFLAIAFAERPRLAQTL